MSENFNYNHMKCATAFKQLIHFTLLVTQFTDCIIKFGKLYTFDGGQTACNTCMISGRL